jgi:hypothetical protein
MKKTALLLMIFINSYSFAATNYSGTWQGYVTNVTNGNVCMLSLTINHTESLFSLSEHTFECPTGNIDISEFTGEITDSSIMADDQRVGLISDLGVALGARSDVDNTFISLEEGMLVFEESFRGEDRWPHIFQGKLEATTN